MTRKIIRTVGEFLRRKLEVWFVLVLIGILGVFGYVVFSELESTQNALCRATHAGTVTMDHLIDEFADAFQVGEDQPNIARMRAFVDEERRNLDGECRSPNQEELEPSLGFDD